MLKTIDLFAGIGGFTLGFEEAGGFETVQFVEQDEACKKVLKKHWEDIPIHSDIRDFHYNDEAQVITGGFPCQDISISGYGKGLSGERSGLWFEYLRVIQEVNPNVVLIENSPMLRTRGLGTVLKGLAEAGYTCEWYTFPASFVGAWHRRNRIWILAYDNSRRCEGFGTEPIFRQSYLSREPKRKFAVWPGRSDLPTPYLLGSLDGIPDGFHRIKQLGNTIVPQIAEAFGEAIKDRYFTRAI